MKNNEDDVVLTIKELADSQRLIFEIIMREGALRFQEQATAKLYEVRKDLKSDEAIAAIDNAIDIVLGYEVIID